MKAPLGIGVTIRLLKAGGRRVAGLRGGMILLTRRRKRRRAATIENNSTGQRRVYIIWRGVVWHRHRLRVSLCVAATASSSQFSPHNALSASKRRRRRRWRGVIEWRGGVSGNAARKRSTATLYLVFVISHYDGGWRRVWPSGQ